MKSKQLIREIAMTAELLGTQFSEGASRMMVADLSEYPEDLVMKALARCRKEHHGRLTLAAIISRIDDGHPGAEEAWAIAKKTMGNENVTVVWTDRIARAAIVADPLADDPIAARMAFLEAYRKDEPDSAAPPQWRICLGYDRAGRAGPVADAVRAGRISQRAAIAALPESAAQFPAIGNGKADMIGFSNG